MIGDRPFIESGISIGGTHPCGRTGCVAIPRAWQGRPRAGLKQTVQEVDDNIGSFACLVSVSVSVIEGDHRRQLQDHEAAWLRAWVPLPSTGTILVVSGARCLTPTAM